LVVPAVATAAGEVVVYTSVDDVFARPVAQTFERASGLRVRLVPDTEETKSTGLVNRLVAERRRPRADVFWSGDPVRTALLRQRGISEPYRSPAAAGLPPAYSDPDGHWTGLSARARVLLYNTRLVGAGDAPRRVADLAEPRFQGKGCMANPLFGTTSMHAAALFQTLGDAAARAFFGSLRSNGVRVLSSNGEVRRAVGAGECAVGIADTDDAAAALRDGKPVAMVFPDADGGGTVIIPNAVMLVKGGPNPEAAKRFIDFLLSPETEAALARSDAAQMPLRPGVRTPPGFRGLSTVRAMPLDYGRLAALLDPLSRGFLKEWVDSVRR
jgi:iron(III) transport system substrate-binding protein